MISWVLRKFAAWALSKNEPGSYLGEDDKRWAYTITTNGDKYLTRIMFPRIFGIRVFLHNFHRTDADRYMHNHPWKWTRSLVLSGSYDEERLGVPKPRRIRFWNKLNSTDYHAVRKLHGDVWTLFITGPRIQDWGFLVEGEHVPWRKFLGKE